MAGMRIFVSSTCYDLSLVRSELRSFIQSMGYEPIMSDYSDVLYDPRIHTHTSCVNEVSNCDMLVVIIGSRLGGKSVPEALENVDFSALDKISKDASILSKDAPVSITQLEVLKAIEIGIPIYTFIDKKVYYEHEIYEKNKNKPDVIDNIIFPAIEKPETAKYIFGFINYIRLRAIGNSIHQFERMEDIEDILRKQWSGYFQRLLDEQRHRNGEHKQIDILNEKFEDLKTAILSSIENVDQREIATGIVHYRRLAEFLFSIKGQQNYLCEADVPFRLVLDHQDVVDVIDFRAFGVARNPGIPRLFLIKKDQTFYEMRATMETFRSLESEWDAFKKMKKKTKEIILDALKEAFRPTPWIRYHIETIQDYLRRTLPQATINEPDEE